MRMGWLDTIPNVQGGVFRIDRNPQGVDFGPVDLSSPPKGVGHTTEGSSEIPNYGSNAPQLTYGKVAIHQHRAFGRMAGTLRNLSGGHETNRIVRMQFELVEFSELVPWLPESNLQCDMLASGFEFAQRELDIPENHVWPDEQAPGTIAVTSYFRRHSRFPGTAGWYTHAEIPENSHWDMGDCLITRLMRREPIPDLVKAHAIYISYSDKHQDDQFHRHSQRITPFFSNPRPAKLFVLANRKRPLMRAMSGKVFSDAHDRVLDVRGARPHVVTKRVPPEHVRD